METEYNKVKSLRNDKEILDNRYKEKKDLFDKQFETLINDRKELTLQLIEAENNLRIKALSIHESLGEKNLYNGVKIRIMKVLIYDTDAAIVWAKQNAPLCFKFNDSIFKKIAKTEPDGCPVTIKEEPAVTIPTVMFE